MRAVRSVETAIVDTNVRSQRQRQSGGGRAETGEGQQSFSSRWNAGVEGYRPESAERWGVVEDRDGSEMR